MTLDNYPEYRTNYKYNQVTLAYSVIYMSKLLNLGQNFESGMESLRLRPHPSCLLLEFSIELASDDNWGGPQLTIDVCACFSTDLTLKCWNRRPFAFCPRVVVHVVSTPIQRSLGDGWWDDGAKQRFTWVMSPFSISSLHKLLHKLSHNIDDESGAEAEDSENGWGPPARS